MSNPCGGTVAGACSPRTRAPPPRSSQKRRRGSTMADDAAVGPLQVQLCRGRRHPRPAPARRVARMTKPSSVSDAAAQADLVEQPAAPRPEHRSASCKARCQRLLIQVWGTGCRSLEQVQTRMQALPHFHCTPQINGINMTFSVHVKCKHAWSPARRSSAGSARFDPSSSRGSSSPLAKSSPRAAEPRPVRWSCE